MNKIQPKTLFVGKNIVYLPTCHSTNDIASEKIQNGEGIDGTIVITDHQTSGRGQRGNTWEALKAQNITMSLILKPSFLRPSEQFDLNMAVSTGIYQFFKANGTEGISIKWPNDIYINDKKAGGILIESTISGNNLNYSVIGIGLNINQNSFSNPRATSLTVETGSAEMPLDALVEQLCFYLETAYLSLKNGHKEEIKKKYLEIMFRAGRLSRFRDENGTFLGTIRGVDPVGKLIVEGEITEKSYDIKEIEYLFD